MPTLLWLHKTELCTKYADQPMDLADACWVRLYETLRGGFATILTVDRTDCSVHLGVAGKFPLGWKVRLFSAKYA